MEDRILPPGDKEARAITLTASQYVIQDDVLFHVEPDSTLRVVPPTSFREQLFREAHAGVFGAHLSDTKVHSELRKHYWWLGMRADITRWTRGCLICATYSTGRAVRPPLTPIPVAGPFDRIGVDVVQLPRTQRGNQYAVVFMDYLTKWPEVFPVADQSAATIATLLVEEIVSRHGVPAEILSDRGRCFLSGLMTEVQKLLGMHRVNTTAYHPQTDGLVERFNRTLVAMLAKTVEKGGDWDERLPHVLFAYRASVQQSTSESPFFLLYGRDPRLPTAAVMCPKMNRVPMDLQEYGAELTERMTGAWELPRKCIGRVQTRQKTYYDKKGRPPNFSVGERVFLFKPAEKCGKTRKLARPYHGPYRVLELDTNTTRIRRVDRPQDDALLVALDRLRRCPVKVKDDFWPPDRRRKKSSQKKATVSSDTSPEDDLTEEPPGHTEELEDKPPDKTPYLPANISPPLTQVSPSQSVTEKSHASSIIPSRPSQWAGRLRSHKEPTAVEDA